jgi:uncharacterized membrane protein
VTNQQPEIRNQSPVAGKESSLMSIIRFFMLLSLVTWIGGIIFFASVVAPAAFGVLPTRHMAGAVVNRTLGALHWIGIVCGIVFAATSMISNRVQHGAAQPFAARHLLVYLMILLTLISQLAVTPRIVALRGEMVEVDRVPQDDPRRLEFNRLHQWSTRLEGAVLLFGLAVVYLTARRLG